jgi:hypothetical protein
MSWNDGFPALATDETLVGIVERGEHLDISGAVSDAFRDRATKVCCGMTPFFGGVPDLKIAVVSGRFRIEEHDGKESIITDDTDGWL